MSSTRKNTKNKGSKYKLRQLVEAPLIATIDAEISLNNRIQEFIRKVGFKQVEAPPSFELRTIEISYVLDKETRILEVPALSLVTLPLLTLKEATLDMDINLSSRKSDKTKFQAQPVPGRVNSLFPNKKSSGNLKVSLKLQEGDMPSGLQELYGKMNQLINVK